MTRDQILLLLFPIMVCLPALVMGFFSKWRNEQIDKEEQKQREALA